MAGLIGLAVAGVEHSARVRMVLARLQDTTAQIRVRAAFLLLIGFVALAGKLGLEVILGAFIAGAIVSLIDRDREMTHPLFRRKLEAVGFGVFIPIFFVTSGVKYDLNALTSSGSTLARVPIFLAALLIARGVPALLYRRLIPRRQVLIAGLMQGTSLPFIVAGTAIGQELGLISAGQFRRADRRRAAVRADLPGAVARAAARRHDARPDPGRGGDRRPRDVMAATLMLPRRIAEVDAHEGPVYVPFEHALYFTTQARAIKRLALDSGEVATVARGRQHAQRDDVRA